MKRLLFAAILLVTAAMGTWLVRNWLDDRAWKIAVHSGTSVACSEYLKDRPRGRHALEASARLSDLRAQEDWDGMPKPRTVEDLAAYLKRHSDGPSSDYARKLLKNILADPQEREKSGYFDLDTIVQTGEDGEPDAHGGVTVRNGHRVSFDSQGRPAPGTAGYWQALSSRTFTVLANAADDQRGALFEMRSTVRWGPDGNIIEGEENILRVTRTDKDHYVQITSRYYKNGGLHLLSADGSDFLLFNPSPDWSATVLVAR